MRKLQKFDQKTCFDSAITQKLNEQLPKSVAYLTHKDLRPPKTTEEIAALRKSQLQRVIREHTDQELKD